ncbi:hypothetical protein RI543_002920 [Arxiozyma heterogenica]|uniref:Uncharacterized protein n=1 Tax=Arxiozyma heterogenica TaxID=278026 RepID=A0AAN7WQL4_9SACH|nr:hypothetical protein RI543_002920 [Kazachstania heterogenica]
MISHQQTQTLKRACSHFELESPFPETLKRKKYSHQINQNNILDSTGRPISPISSIYMENKVCQLKQNPMEEQYRYQNRNDDNYSNSHNNRNIFSRNFMTPIPTPLNQTRYINHINNIYNANSEPYCEVEEYMAKGYESMEYNSHNIQLHNGSGSNNNENKNSHDNNMASMQYSLYDLTQEELDMMIMDDATLTNINAVC